MVCVKVMGPYSLVVFIIYLFTNVNALNATVVCKIDEDCKDMADEKPICYEGGTANAKCVTYFVQPGKKLGKKLCTDTDEVENEKECNVATTQLDLTFKEKCLKEEGKNYPRGCYVGNGKVRWRSHQYWDVDLCDGKNACWGDPICRKIKCKWETWGAWTYKQGEYEKCGNGKEPKVVIGIRHRAKPGNEAQCNPRNEEMKLTETAPKDCPEHCQLHDWEQWGQWTNSQQSCGSHKRTQKIKKVAQYEGNNCSCDSLPIQAVEAICHSPSETITCPGEFEFENTTERVNNTAVFLEIKVVRKNGDNGTVTVTLKGVEGTAIQDQDYGLAETSVQFADRQTEKSFKINIHENNQSSDTSESKQFQVELTDASGNAIPGPKNIITITIDIATVPTTTSITTTIATTTTTTPEPNEDCKDNEKTSDCEENKHKCTLPRWKEEKCQMTCGMCGRASMPMIQGIVTKVLLFNLAAFLQNWVKNHL